MLVMRLTRGGKKKQPTYRVVVQEKHRDPWGTSLEIVGHYNPRSTPKTVVFKEDRVKHWLAKGVQPSETVHNLLVDAKLAKGDTKVRATKKDLMDRAKAAEEAAAKAAAEAEKAEAEKAAAEAAKAEEEAAKAAEAEKAAEAPAEEKKEEAPAEEAPAEAPAEEEKKEESAE